MVSIPSLVSVSVTCCVELTVVLLKVPPDVLILMVSPLVSVTVNVATPLLPVPACVSPMGEEQDAAAAVQSTVTVFVIGVSPGTFSVAVIVSLPDLELVAVGLYWYDPLD